ncbi:MAG: protein YgfX [Pseudomonas sp.]|uniref:protein YgfX n=1 Tax=Pseudomonas sp. TaxID=306 RepID=UPI003D0EE2B4
MSSPSDSFECHWQPSRCLLALYLLLVMLAGWVLALIEAPGWVMAAALALCLGHVCWMLSRHLLPGSSRSFRRLRRDSSGWQLWSASAGWQPVQLRPDSLALPFAVVLRFRLAGERRVRGLCIARDAMAADMHRRLRVRLKFSRRRWAAPE